ncbi:MAG TPA: hypothetical protein VIH91_09705 [Terriglobales bacterium]
MIATSIRIGSRGFIILLIAGLAASCHSQEMNGTYADLSIPGQWKSAKQFASQPFGEDIFYDASTGSVVQMNQQAGMRRVGEIAKFFSTTQSSSKDAAGVMSVGAFPLPVVYTEKASKDLAKGTKPPRIWDIKDGEGNPLWFYASQLFDSYQLHDSGGSSEVREEFQPVRVTKAEQRSVQGGDALLFEVESDKPAADAVLKRFHMPAAYKDQRIRFGWLQFAPGGIAAGQGVLSVTFATSASSPLNIEEVLKQVSAAKIKPL